MAFGLSPQYSTEVSLDNLTKEHFIALIVKAVEHLGWDIRHVSETGIVAYSGFSMSSWSEEISVTVNDTDATLKSECLGSQLADWGKNKRNVESLIAAFEDLRATLTPEELDEKYASLKSTFTDVAEGSAELPTAKSRFNGLLGIFIPRKGYAITPVLIYLNIAIFIIMVVSGVDFMNPKVDDLLSWGANLRSITLQGQWWRLLTCTFIHIGVLHLLFNMYALLYIGLLLEPYLGRLRFLAAYLLTGIAASETSLWIHEQTVSAGASGAIFGLYGVFLAMLTTNFIDKSVRKPLLSSIMIFVFFNLVNGMKGNIDNAAHIGGLVSGFIIGYLYYPSLKNPDSMYIKMRSVALLSVFILFACFVICKITPDYIGQYNAKMKTFATTESMALEIYRMPKNARKDSILYEIKDRGIYYWNEDLDLLRDMDRMTLPDELHERNKALIRYCKLRVKSYNLIYKAVNEDTDRYKDSIQFYNDKIQAMIDSLKN